VRAAVSAQRARRLLLEGEIVAFDGEQTSFGRLQQRLGVRAPSADLVSAHPVVYCVLDLLELDGEDVTDRPLLERRARLERSIRPREGLQLSEATRSAASPRLAAPAGKG
jgi:bifunctional non-homologous end joining protein LigD